MGDLTPLFLKKLLSSLYLTLYFREMKLFPHLIYTEGTKPQLNGRRAALVMYLCQGTERIWSENMRRSLGIYQERVLLAQLGDCS